jgi:hypothetical protein
MLPGMEDIYRRHLQGLTRTARGADACADAHHGRVNAGRTIATVTASEAAAGAPESVNPVNSPSPTT